MHSYSEHRILPHEIRDIKGTVAKWTFPSLRGPNGAVAIRNFLLKRTPSHGKCRLSGGIIFGMTGWFAFCNSPFYILFELDMAPSKQLPYGVCPDGSLCCFLL